MAIVIKIKLIMELNYSLLFFFIANKTFHPCHSVSSPTGSRTSACTLSSWEKLILRLKDDSSISSLRDRSSVLNECSSVTAWGGQRWSHSAWTSSATFFPLMSDSSARPWPPRGVTTRCRCLEPHAHLRQLFHQPLVVIGQLSQLFTLVPPPLASLVVSPLQVGPQGGQVGS